MTLSETDIDTRICPLCGQPNRCAMAGCDNAPDTPCWCKSEQFSHALLDQLPEDARNRACICKQCMKNYSRS